MVRRYLPHHKQRHIVVTFEGIRISVHACIMKRVDIYRLAPRIVLHNLIFQYSWLNNKYMTLTVMMKQTGGEYYKQKVRTKVNNMYMYRLNHSKILVKIPRKWHNHVAQPSWGTKGRGEKKKKKTKKKKKQKRHIWNNRRTKKTQMQQRNRIGTVSMETTWLLKPDLLAPNLS